MQINWLEFTPGPALLGGVILGLAAALYVHLHGRILGISGIISGLFTPKSGDVLWRLSVILGLLSAPLWAAVLFEMHPIQVIDASWAAIVVAGLLIGFGAIYGSGCTSGHGICGLSRLSPRSVLATLIFMFSGFITVYITRHILGI